MQEREIVARLEHPGIARLIDGGSTDNGTLGFAMEWVDGAPIDRWCAAQPDARGQAIRLLIELCDALSFAHTRLLVHRDIKEKSQGAEHSLTRLARLNLIRAYAAVNRLDQAQAMLQQEQVLRARVWGANHAEYARFLRERSFVLLQRKDFAAAISDAQVGLAERTAQLDSLS
jgi:hypothetical protein